MHSLDLYVKVNLVSAVMNHKQTVLCLYSLSKFFNKFSFQVIPHLFAHDGAGCKQSVNHDTLNSCVKKRFRIFHQCFIDTSCRFFYHFRFFDTIHVHLLLVAKHGECSQRTKYKGNNRIFSFGVFYQFFADIDVHHHSFAGTIIHFLNLFIILFCLDYLIFIVGVRRIFFLEFQFLSPCSTFYGKVDQCDNAVTSGQFSCFDKSLCTNICIG